MSGYRFVYMLLLLTAFAIGELYADCTFSLNEHVPKTPILMSVSRTPNILYPNYRNTLKVQTGARIKLSCGDNHFDEDFKKFKVLYVRCNGTDMVNVKGRQVHLKELECENFTTSVARMNASKSCYKNYKRYDIGFKIRNTYLNMFHVCFDDREQNSVYSWYDSSMLHKGHQSRVSRPYFVHDNIYSFPVENCYDSTSQREVFAKLLKSRKLAEKYIKDDGNRFLSRGHLTPKADFVYGAEQAATFHYINAAPQWQAFNGGNWNHIEISVRNELEKENKRYSIYRTYRFNIHIHSLLAALDNLVYWY